MIHLLRTSVSPFSIQISQCSREVGLGQRSYQLKIHDFKLKEIYLSFIKEGKKLCEGRPNKTRPIPIEEGETIRFTSNSNSSHQILCLVEKKMTYVSFREMLEKEGVENCLPGIQSVEDGINIYHGFRDYESLAKKYGVVTYRIKYIQNS